MTQGGHAADRNLRKIRRATDIDGEVVSVVSKRKLNPTTDPCIKRRATPAAANRSPAEYTPQRSGRRRPTDGRGLLGHCGWRRRSAILAWLDTWNGLCGPGLAVLFAGNSLLGTLCVAGDRAERLLSGLERFHDRFGIAGSGRQTGLQVHAHELDAGRSTERNWRLVSKRDLEK